MDLVNLIAFAAVAFGLVITPGPNMIYLLSRSISQGVAAGMVSLVGIASAFVVYALLAAFGITALLMAVPYAYDAIRAAGAAYLLYLAWQAVRPNGRSPLQVRHLQPHNKRKLIAMGFMTNLLNPKAAVLYLSLLPQFIVPGHGSILTQSLVLAGLQILISASVNSVIIVSAGSLAAVLAERPLWLVVQRWLMGGVLGSLALRLAIEGRRH
jgi:threonine/homoserine/homoserine lactone efflux protein